MPTYEYVCRACKHEFEAFQSMSDGPKRKCPSCGKSALERKIGTGAAIIFKGSGFYQTDYRSESYKKSAEADSKPAGDVKTDAKPDSAGKPAAETKPATETKPAAVTKPATESKPAEPKRRSAPKPSASKAKPASKSKR